MKLINLVVELLTEQENRNIEFILNKFQKDNKITLSNESKNILQDILQTFKSGRGYVKWLLIKMSEKSLLEEDLYKYKNFFKYYEKGKSLGHFTENDILKYKNPKKFEKEAINSNEKLSKLTPSSDTNDDSKNYITPEQIKTLENNGILFLGMTPDKYQVFKIPKGLENNEQAWKSYKNILGRCKGREDGGGIQICTISNFGHFKNYVSKDDLYVFYNLNDPKSPYQFHYGDNQFMDKDDQSLV